MYRNLTTILRRRDLRVGQKFHCKVVFGRAIRSAQYCIVTIERRYHSENGVYGYRPKIQQHFEVGTETLANRAKHSNFYRLVTAYREHAHKQADINPISLEKPVPLPELLPKKFGLDLSDRVSFRGILTASQSEGTVKDALDILNKVYSSSIGAEFSYLDTEEEREWFAETLEKYHDEPISSDTQKAILTEMLKSQVFDNFLAIKFVSFKRYGCEGAESMMAFFHELFKLSAHDTLENIVMCMPHRGRLNFLTGMLEFPPEKLFRKLRGFSEFPDDAQATGDVTSHFTSSVNLSIDNEKLHVTMLYNPSHLEAVNPVSMGKTRATMQAVKDGAYSDTEDAQWSDKVLNLQVHGDAAYTGQGVNQECLGLCSTPHFEIGGSIHIIVNNQLGFTTPASRGRSSRYPTDLAKFIAAPVIHVNGDDPNMVVRATRIAFKYQRKFRKDVFINFNCFRRWGHNELDDPTFTNPAIYKIIQNRQSIPDRYLENLIKTNVVTAEEGKSIVEKHMDYLAQALKQVDNYIPQPTYFMGKWSEMKQASSAVTTWNTGVDVNLLKFIANKSVQVTSDLDVHPRVLKSHIEGRLKRVANNEELDWATAEAMAFGSLLYQGYHVRISGQDIGRGTFSHRHAMLVNQQTGSIFIPLNSMIEGQIGKIELANSILSEEAVLGYEYGLSIESPNTLAIWEAQFGDFFNGAQLIIDTFITSGETKWMTSSGLTMLLPHGYDGAGPDHTSCRIERFLQLTDSREDKPDGDNVNIQVANPTTPAQYFHLLRRQMIRDFRKPLVVVAPKILLRHVDATSLMEDMGLGTNYKNVIGDSEADVNKVTKVILVSGKHYYGLEKHRQVLGAKNVAIIRLESLCPFPILELHQEVQKYKHARTLDKIFLQELEQSLSDANSAVISMGQISLHPYLYTFVVAYIWSQEEPQNMGAWSFVKPRFENLCGRSLKYCGRETLSTPAVGIGHIHQREAKEVIVKPFTME